MFYIPKAFLEEFRRDVVAVARKGESTIVQISEDFGVDDLGLLLIQGRSGWAFNKSSAAT